MHVTFRPGTVDDIGGCLRLLPPAFECDPALRARMPDLWRRWLHQRCLLFTVLEDADQPPSRQLVAFGTSVFITDAFARDLDEVRLPPSPPVEVMARALAGRSPILSLDEIKQGNSGDGLTNLVLHIGWDEAGRTEEEVRRLKAKLFEAFGFCHAGYQLKGMLQEVYSEAEMRRGLAIGAFLRTDYADYYRSINVPPDTSRRPYLIGVRREEVVEGSFAATMFFYSPPRFHFKSGEQDMLQQALIGKSDAEQAACLHLSPSTIHKRWLTIYDRALAVAPELLPDDMASGLSSTTRGAEKRRHLLAYLRHHPEELRPHLPPKGRKG